MLACSDGPPIFGKQPVDSSSSSRVNDTGLVDAGDAGPVTTSTAVGATGAASTHSTIDTADSHDVTSATTEADASVPDTTEPDTLAPDATEANADCADGFDCVACDDTCQPGEARCTDGELRHCEEDAQGCFDWGAATECDSAACATAASCVVCDDECSVGNTICDQDGLRTCVADAVGCLDWSAATPCNTGECSSATQCLVCEDTCASGTYSCSGSQLSSCMADVNGCYDYTPAFTCEGNTPTCNAEAGRCECQSGAAPTCTNLTTSSQCSAGAWTDSACGGNTPVCVNGSGCQACTEHSQCPSSACHLAGSKKGTCFDTGSVVNVANAAALLNAVNATTADGEAVIRLSPGTYTMTSTLAPKGETAIIGESGVVIVDNTPFPGDARGSFLGAAGPAYFAKFELRNTSADHTGIGTNGVLWLDDVKIVGQYHGVISNGECHLRRTLISNYGSSGVSAYYSGSVFLENSMIGPGASVAGTTGVGAYSGGVLDVRYSTIVGNDRGIGCSLEQSSGRIANSIIASNLNGYSIADDTSDCSEVFTLVTNAVDQTGYGTKIASYNSSWFESAGTGDLHLSAAGKVAVPPIAVIGSGDPLLDIDGTTRPASAGYPGADEP